MMCFFVFPCFLSQFLFLCSVLCSLLCRPFALPPCRFVVVIFPDCIAIYLHDRLRYYWYLLVPCSHFWRLQIQFMIQIIMQSISVQVTDIVCCGSCPIYPAIKVQPEKKKWNESINHNYDK